MGVSFDAEWQLASRIECGRLPSTNAFLSTATMRFRLNFTFSYCHEEGTPIARFFGALNRFSIHLTIALAGESPAPIVYPFQPCPPILDGSAFFAYIDPTGVLVDSTPFFLTYPHSHKHCRYIATALFPPFNSPFPRSFSVMCFSCMIVVLQAL